MGLLYKLDVRDTGNLWANTGKTTPASNGSAVAVWSPSSGSSITDDCTQSTTANQPTYVTNYASSGYAAVSFDGSNDRLLTIDSAAWDVSAITVVMAARMASITGDRIFCSKWDALNWNNGWGLGLSGSRFIGGVNSWNASGPPATSGAMLMAIRSNGTTWRDSFFDGLGWGSFSSLSNPANAHQFAIGAANHGGYAAAIGIHCIAIYDTALTNSEIDQVLYDCDNAFGLGQYATRSAGKPTHPLFQQVIG